eukprot:scaffold925_cov129-Cylindrotheca_fusiformis.AAC.8
MRSNCANKSSERTIVNCLESVVVPQTSQENERLGSVACHFSPSVVRNKRPGFQISLTSLLFVRLNGTIFYETAQLYAAPTSKYDHEQIIFSTR